MSSSPTSLACVVQMKWGERERLT